MYNFEKKHTYLITLKNRLGSAVSASRHQTVLHCHGSLCYPGASIESTRRHTDNAGTKARVMEVLLGLGSGTAGTSAWTHTWAAPRAWLWTEVWGCW